MREHCTYFSKKSLFFCHVGLLSAVLFLMNLFTLTVLCCFLQVKIHQLLQEMDSILAEQKVVSCVAEKALWWEGRRALDSRVEVSCKDLHVLL